MALFNYTSRKRSTRGSVNRRFASVLLSFLGLVVLVGMLPQATKFYNRAASDKSKKIYKIPGNLKEISKGKYDLGEFTGRNGEKIWGIMYVDILGADESDMVLGAGSVLQSTSDLCAVYAYTPDRIPTTVAGDEVSTTYYFDSQNSSGITQSQMQGVIDRSGTRWEAAAGESALFGKTSYSDLNPDPNNPVLLNYRNEIYFARLTVVDPHGVISPSRALAVTNYYYNSFGNITEVDIIINDYYPYTVTNEAGKYPLEGVITHEMGHAVGLGDVYDPACYNSTIMYAGSNSEITGSSLYPDDIEAAQGLYGDTPLPTTTATPTPTAQPTVTPTIRPATPTPTRSTK